MPEPTYTPPQLADEVQTLAENYRSTFVDFHNISDAIDYCNAGTEEYHSKVEGLESEIAEDNAIFEDISEAIQGKTGQVEPYDKSEMADVISQEWVQLTLITKNITENGTYTASEETPLADGYSEVTVNVPISIPIDEDSQVPLYFGVSANGFVLSSDPADETPVAFGVDANNHPYVKGGTA